MPRVSGARHRHEAELDVLARRRRASVCTISGMCWCSSGLYVCRFPARTGWCVPRLRRDARARRAGDADDVTTAPSSRPARASGRSASSIVVAKQPGDATYFAALICVAVELGQAVDERAEQLGVRVLRAVELLVDRRVAQAEVARQVDDLHARRDQLGHLRRGDLVRQREEHDVQPFAASAGVRSSNTRSVAPSRFGCTAASGSPT